MKLTTFGWISVAALALASTPIACFDAHAPTCTVDCASDADCPGGLTCGPSNKCSHNGASCEDTNTPCTLDALRCKPGGDPAVVEKCDASGAWTTSETCATGCVAEAVPHCGHIEPTIAALKTICDVTATTPVRVLTGNTTILTDDEAMCDFTIAQGGGPEICVIRAGTLLVAQGSLIAFRGPPAIALVADGNVTIEGSIDATGTSSADGPGGGGTRVSGEASMGHYGGGGAGFRTAGAAGGAGSPGAGNAGGAAVPDPTLSPILVGGFRPKVLAADSSFGGGAGGAIAVISCTGTVKVSAVIDAGGGGGQPGGDYAAGDFRSGAGGGSGGLISIQAPHIDIATGGSLYANGGGGGGGNSLSGNLGMLGEEATTSNTVCARGGLSGGTAGRGGDGACGTTLPSVGLGDTAAISGGGGGGSMGYSILYTPAGITPTTGVNASSPALTLATANLR